MNDIDFKQIVPRCGGQREAFEELCCQLARRTVPSDVSFARLHGAGGDGGVECFTDLQDGNRMGWQAKYVFNIDSLFAQGTDSLTTALKIHSKLTHYVICFPFDLTGPTGRKGMSGLEKFDNWEKDQVRKAERNGRRLTLQTWPAFKLRDLLLEHDASGGIREFFFNQQILTTEWFSEHLDLAKETAGPRYTPELNVKTDLWKWFAAFGRTNAWSNAFRHKLRACRKSYGKITSALNRAKSDSTSPTWPENLREEAQAIMPDVEAILDESNHIITADDASMYWNCVNRLDGVLDRFTSLESKLIDDLEGKHGHGRADSPGFRQFMAEHMVSFPAANLDDTRETIDVLKDLHDWLCSPASSLAYEDIFVLSGDAGSGKTHGTCDATAQRSEEGLLTCVTFGHEFRGEPDPGTRLLENFQLPITLGMNGLLDVLNAAGEASGSPLILCVDAINETRPLRYWRDRLSAVSQTVQRRPYLRLVVTCRTPFIPYCLPDGHGFPIIEHTGFAGVEREACRVFFQHYELEPPISPILQPEWSNPLYLLLVCKTLRALGLQRLPAGWQGLAQTIRAFLQEKERQFAAEHETSESANIVGGCLMAIVRAIADSNDTALVYSQAQRAISNAKPQADTLQVIEWLVRADLLIEDPPPADASFDAESLVRPAFERMGDFLIASEYLERSDEMGFDTACQSGGLLHSLWKDSDAIERNNGVLAALSILIPEQKRGLELPGLADDDLVSDSLVIVAIRSLPSRDPSTFSSASACLIRRALERTDISFNAMDAILATAWSPSTIDAFWLDGLLQQKPLAKRDAYWCGYLHDRFESQGIVHRLINAAFELPLDRLEPDTAERWSIVLFWFCAAADRRVKDEAARAAIAILTIHPEVISDVLRRMILCDDDEVRERALLGCYGAMIVSRDTDVIGNVTGMLQEIYSGNPVAFDNALIRDNIRCIYELARELDCLPDDCDPEASMKPISSEWPLELPTEKQVEAWSEQLHFKPDEFWSDFFKYSMYCLRAWEHALPKKNMGEWILQRAARDLGYLDSRCEKYDAYMLGKHGGGRSKPNWAERIGKKYQWVAMYQLASRLHDHVERKRDSWETEPLQTPLILEKGRKIDPTLPPNVVEKESDAGSWWMNSSVDLDSAKMLSDADWIASKEGIPALENLLSIVQNDGQNWRLLVSYPSWGQRDEDADWNDPYRQVWIHIKGYLVQKQDIATAYDCLHRRNFFGNWMPGGATWLYGFAGEYPWGTLYKNESEAWHGSGGFGDVELPIACEPCWNQLAVEWEYDATLLSSMHMFVPVRTFFAVADLSWNGRNGYRLAAGETIFLDPSVTKEGPAALLADADELADLLEKLDMSLIWTMLGEKWILGGRNDGETPRRTFSQIAHLEEDGSLCIGERVFFDDYGIDRGPK